MRTPAPSTIIATALTMLCAGCAAYRPAPLSAVRNAQEIQARSLDDPRLRTFVAAARAGAPSRADGGVDDGAATDAQVRRNWDLATLTLAALYFHPDLDLARADIAEARAGVGTARQVPNPSLSFEDLSYAPGAPPGTAWTIAPVVNFMIETFGKREKRTAEATAMLQAARSELRSASWRVRAGVRDALIELWAAQQRLDLLQARLDAQGQLVTLLERGLTVGEISGLELARDRADRNRLNLAARDAERAAIAARSQLAASIGIPLQALDGVHLSFDAFEKPAQPETAVADSDLRQEALTQRSDVQTLLADYAAAEAALALEVANQYPNLTLSPGYEWDAGRHRYMLLPAVDLPLFNQNQGPIAQARARREQAAARFTALQTQIIDSLDGATALYRASNQTLATADSLLNGEQDRERQTLRMFKAGEIDRPTLLSVQLERIAAEESKLDVTVQQRQALAAVEDALQHPFFGSPWPADAETNPRAAALF
jgi:cobalt-zinc-cadmium efflux system outer membrane protein